MKWCMVAAIAVSLLFIFSGMAFAQGDDFDLDALLGDVGVDVAADAGSASPASQEAEVAEAFDDSMDAFAAEPRGRSECGGDPFAEPEVVADDFDADAFAEADAPQMPPQACRTILLPQTWRMIRLPQARKTHLRKLPHRKPRMILPPQRPIRIFWVTYWQRSLSKKRPLWQLRNPIS